MPDQPTQRTRRVMTLANDFAVRHGLSEVTDSVVLIAMTEEGRGVAATLLEAAGVDLAALYRDLPNLPTDLRLDLVRPLPVSAEC